MSPRRLSALLLVLSACGEPLDSGRWDDTAAATDTATPDDTAGSDDTASFSGPYGWEERFPRGDPFADAVVAFTPGEAAGFGAEGLPDVVLGHPRGGGDQGSLDVLSLGREGHIVLEFLDYGLVDGPGPDLLVFENPFVGWPETGRVAVSDDGTTWSAWPCDADDAEGGFPGCAGVANVWAHPGEPIDATDPQVAGGEAFDLADLGLPRARFVRITDSGANSYGGQTGGFDLDAVAVVNGEPLP